MRVGPPPTFARSSATHSSETVCSVRLTDWLTVHPTLCIVADRCLIQLSNRHCPSCCQLGRVTFDLGVAIQRAPLRRGRLASLSAARKSLNSDWSDVEILFVQRLWHDLWPLSGRYASSLVVNYGQALVIDSDTSWTASETHCALASNVNWPMNGNNATAFRELLSAETDTQVQ